MKAEEWLFNKSISLNTLQRALRGYSYYSLDDVKATVAEALLKTVFEDVYSCSWYTFTMAAPGRKLKEKVLEAFVQMEHLWFEDVQGNLHPLRDETSMQTLMDIAGVWYKPFSPPEGVKVYCLNQDKVEEKTLDEVIQEVEEATAREDRLKN